MSQIKGTNVIAPVVPLDTADQHPSHEARYGKGGYRTVATTVERDAIPAPRREAGMLVYVEADGKAYKLLANLTSWEEFKSGASTWEELAGKPSTFTPSAHVHAISDVTGLQTALDAKATPADVTSAVAAVVNAAPAALDTLNELAAALGNDASFATTVTNALAGKAAAVHTHVIADVTGLQTALDGKQASGSYAAAVHTHGISDVTGLQTALDGKQAAGSYAAAVHGHAIADVTGLQTALDGKQAAGSYAAAVHTHGISDVTGLQTALDGKAASSHTHTASQITDFTAAVVAAAPPTVDASLLTTGTLSASRLPSTSVTPGSYGSASSVATYTVDATGRLTAAGSTSIAIAAGAVSGLAAIATSGSASDLGSGTVATARLGSGTADSTTFLRGDGTWATAGSNSASDLTTGTLAAARIGAHASSHQTGGSDAVTNVVVSPSQITGNQNDYSPGTGDIVRLSSDAARNITGITAGSSGEVRVLVNVGSFTITLVHQSTSSTAANRFLVSFGADYLLAANAAAVIIYDGTTSRWRVI